MEYTTTSRDADAASNPMTRCVKSRPRRGQGAFRLTRQSDSCRPARSVQQPSGIFFDQPKVADAVWDLFRDVFGIQKTSVRVVIGVASLPLGVPIGLDVIFGVAE
jgi:hypothetical protein